MSKMEVDANSTLSIMEQIQNLIKPPPNEEEKMTLRPTNTKHPYYKRPGRGHNHDLCDACEEGGDLLCCDRCPSSFHLQCHDPPLNEEDIPSGQWLCHNCRMTLKGSVVTAASSSSKASSVERNAVGSTHSVGNATSVSAGNNNSRPNTPSTSNSITADIENMPLKVRNLRKRSSSRNSFCSDLGNNDKYLSKLPMAIQKALDPNKKPTPLDELIKAASILNPKQFELPRELEIHSQFPGNDKIEPIRTNGNGHKKPYNVRRNSKPYELDSHGLVPLPAKTCYYCRKSCKRAPLVACDYCTSYFHQDCLDPPMTALPTGLWMCPNHVENFVDNNLVNSISATERVRLWDKFAQPFDHDSVKMEFFRRVHMRNPPFRIKLPVRPRDAIDIPVMVKYHYENPPSLLPSLRDALRYDMVKRRKCLPVEPEEISKETVTESIIKDLQALQSAKAKFREIQKSCNLPVSSSEEEESEPEDDKAESTQDETSPAQSNNAENSTADDEIAEIPLNNNRKAAKKRCKKPAAAATNSNAIVLDCNDNQNEQVLTNGTAAAAANATIKTENEEYAGKSAESHATASNDEEDAEELKYNPQIDVELRYLDVDLIKKLAFQRLQQLVQEHPEIVGQYQNRTAAKRIRELTLSNANGINNDALPSHILSPDDVRRLSIMFTGETSSILAQNNSHESSDMPQLHPALATAAAIVAADQEEQKYVTKQRSNTEKAFEIASRLELKLMRCKIRARAVLTPLGDILEENRWFSTVELHDSYFMRYRHMHIGYGNTAVDVNLSHLGYCRRISAKHATIFYDDFTKTYELINYSEFGTEVNGLLYSCDFSEPTPTPAKRFRNEDIELQRRVREILDKRRGVERKYYVVDKNARMSAPVLPECKCNPRDQPPMIAGAYEGSAILTHGSLLRFGCLSFVFSIAQTDCIKGQG